MGARRGVVAHRELIEDGHGDVPPWITGAPTWVKVAIGDRGRSRDMGVTQGVFEKLRNDDS